MHQKQKTKINVFSHGKVIDITSPFCRLLRTSRVLLFAVILAITTIVPFSMHEVFNTSARAQTPNTTINYQARLLLASGALVPDGYYNVEFKLYDSISGGASAQGACVGGVTDDCVWIETRDYNGGSPDRRVRVVNGYLSVNLGSVSAFGSTIPWNQDLYVTMRIGGSGTSPSWDTEMVNSGNRMKLSAVPYAFRASQLASVDSGFTSTLSFDTPTQNNAILLPNDSGTVCLTTGNCAGVGGTGDILDGGQAGAISIGTTNNTTLTLLQNGSAALTVSASQLLRFNAYNCSTFANGGALTADASGNVTCTDDDSGGSSGDSISINGSSATDLNFIDTTATGTVAGISLSLNTTPAPDELTLSVSNASDTIAGVVTTGAQTFAGLKTFNNGLAIAASQTLTINSDSFDDLTGAGLVISSGDLQVDTSSSSGAFINGGNAFTANSSIGNTGNYSLAIKTNNQNRILFGGAGGATIYENTTLDGDLTVETAGSNAYVILGSDTSGANDRFTLSVSETYGFSVNEFGSPIPRFNVELNGATTLRVASQSFNILNGSSVNIFKVDASTGMVGINDPTPSVALDVNGSGAFTGTLAVNGDVITADSNLTLNGNGYVRIGDTGTPNLATTDDDLYVEGDVEFDSTLSVGAAATFFSTVAVQGSSLSLGATASTNGVLTLLNSSNAYGVSINASGQTIGSATISIPNTLGANDTLCLLTLNNCAAGATGFVDEGNSFGNTAVLGTNDSNSLVFETNNQSAATIAVGGATTFRNATNSTGAFSIQNATGSRTVLSADTSNIRLGIGTASPSYTLEVSQGNAATTSSGITYDGTPLNSSTAYGDIRLNARNTPTSSSWSTSYDTSETSIESLVFDSTNGVIYAGSATGGIIYRCAVSTACDASGDWTTSYDTPDTTILSLAFDSTNGVIYAGSHNTGIIYRCAVSTACDASGDWTTSYDTPIAEIQSIIVNEASGLIFASGFSGGIIYRCAVSTACDASGDWTTSFDAAETNIMSMEIDTTNNIMYAGSNSTGTVYRCDVAATACDASGDWTTSYDSAASQIWSLEYDNFNKVLYAGSGTGGIIYRCDVAATACDASGDWTTSYDSPATNVYSMYADQTNNKLYAATSGSGIIYVCSTLTACDASGDWSTSTDSTENDINIIVGDTVNNILYAGTSAGGMVLRLNGALGTFTTFSRIEAFAVDTANTSEDGALGITTLVNGTAVQGFYLQGGSATIGTSTVAGSLNITNGSGGNLASVTNTGATTFQNSANSTTAFRVLNAAATSTVLNVDTSNARVGVGTASPAASLQVSGNQSSAAWGTSGMGLRVSAGTYTDTTSSGTVANAVAHSFSQPTLAANSATTYTEAATLFVANAPTAGSNVTITNGYALQVGTSATSGAAALFYGNVTVNGSQTTLGDATTDRLTVTAQISGGSPLVFQGATNDGNFTTLAVTDPTGTNTITLPDATGTVVLGTSGTSIAGTSAFVQGGNTWAGTATLGTNDANSLVLETNNQSAVTIASGGTVTFQNAVDSSAGFIVRNQAGTALFVVDTSNNRIGTGTTTGASTNSQQFLLRTGDATGSSSNTGDVLVRSGSSTSGTSGNVSLEVGGFGTTPGTINIGSSNRSNAINIGISGTSAIQSAVNIATTTGNAVQTVSIGSSTNASSSVSIIAGSTGGINLTSNATVLSSVSTSATQLEVRDGSSSTVTLFVADSTNDRVYIGDTTADATGTLLVLDTKNDTGDPTGVNGGSYYNSNSGKFRCYEAGTWKDCLAGGGANTSLSNLASVAVNTDLLPGVDDTYDLGSSSLRWQDLYLGPASLHVYCTAAECTSARDWSLGVVETAGATQGNLRLGLAGANNVLISTTGNTTLSGTLTVSGTGASSFGGNVSVAATSQLTFGSTVSDKINLYSTTYGFGVSGSTLQVYSGGVFSFRQSGYNGTEVANLSAAGALQLDGALTVDGTGQSTIAGILGLGEPIYQDVSSATYDVWIAAAGGSGETRNLAVLGNATNDDLIINYNGEYDCVSVGGTSCTAALTVSGGGSFSSTLTASGSYSLSGNSGTLGGDYVTLGSSGSIPDQVTLAENLVANSGIGIQSGSLVWYQSTSALGSTGACRSAGGASGWNGQTVYALGHCTASSQRYKNTINNYTVGLPGLRALRPVTYYYNLDYAPNIQNLQVGFIAEEVAQVDSKLAIYENGIIDSVDYPKITVLLTKGVQELDVQVQSNDTRMSVIEAGNFSGNLTVAQDVWVGDDLTVVDDVIIQSSLTVQGNSFVQDITVNGKIITAGATPTIVLGAQATGLGASAVVIGNSSAGSIQYNPGIAQPPANAVSSGAQARVVFTSAYSSQPRISLTAKDSNSAAVRYFVETDSTGFTVHFLDSPIPGEVYNFDYIIVQ